MESVPRHAFVPPPFSADADANVALPIGLGQTISQPFVVAYMSAGLASSPGDRVLEVGTGSGYQAAILASMEVEVFTIEVLPELSRRAEAVITSLGLAERVHFRVGDGWHGWPSAAPFDGILCTAAPGSLPPPLLEQLRDGGRLVIPVGPLDSQTLYVLEKRGPEDLAVIHQIAVRFVPLVRPDYAS